MKCRRVKRLWEEAGGGGYSTNIWVEASRWGFETVVLFRRKKSQNSYPVYDNTPNLIIRTNDKMNAVLLWIDLCLAIAIEEIHIISLEDLEHKQIHQINQLNLAGNFLFIHANSPRLSGSLLDTALISCSPLQVTISPIFWAFLRFSLRFSPF